MTKPGQAFYLTRDIRLVEQKAVGSMGLAEEELMMRAGTAAFNTLKAKYPQVKTIAVFCGGGNNAGDGYVLAQLACEHGLSVVVYQYKAVDDLPPAACHAALRAIAAGVPCQCLDDVIDTDVELVVDALVGIGLQAQVRDPIAHAINLINDSGLPVFALDVPSGLDADTGRILGVCINAAVTATFIAPKIGMYTLDGPDQCGEIVCHDLQLGTVIAAFPPAAYQLDQKLLHAFILPRKKNVHKGMHGHVLIIGGGLGMPGAVCLAALAALRVGAGMVSIATRPEHAAQVVPLVPEAMIYSIVTVNDLLPLLAKATICVIGPGLGEDKWAQALFDAAIAAQLPLVIDASALRMIAKNPQHDDNWVLTPHPGEAADLLACSSHDIQANRLRAAKRMQQQYGGTVVLKGVGTVINTGEGHAYICTAGNPGMASAGMGDVLSGVIGGLLAQGVPLAAAAQLGVWLHARAGDDAVAVRGTRGLLARDLMPYLRNQINAVAS